MVDITYFPERGYITLQVPKDLDLSYFPNEWFVKVKDNRISFTDGGNIFLSKLGWEANKDKFKSVFTGNWTNFEIYAKQFYEKLQKSSINYLDCLKKSVRMYETQLMVK